MKPNLPFGNTTAPARDPRPSYIPSCTSIGVGTSKQWKYSLTLTLEELFKGRICPIRITRRLLSGQRISVILDVDVPPGCQSGTEITFLGVGHEHSPGGFQDIVFVIEQAHHDRFIRTDNDLVMDVKVPWTDDLKNQDGKICFPGVDGRLISTRIPRPQTRLRGSLTGTQIVCDAGMPIWFGDKIVGRGNLVVR